MCTGVVSYSRGHGFRHFLGSGCREVRSYVSLVFVSCFCMQVLPVEYTLLVLRIHDMASVQAVNVQWC